MRLTIGTIDSSSAVSPELENAISTSSRVIMPRSPWLASAGCTKNDGVPVEASVAATLRPMWPDLPMPDTTTRPVQPRIIWTALVNAGVSRSASAETASASILRVWRASLSARSASKLAIMATKYTNECDGDRPGFFGHGVPATAACRVSPARHRCRDGARARPARSRFCPSLP
ncbi:hypothetical protein D3C87_1199820 [compost metagenome]